MDFCPRLYILNVPQVVLIGSTCFNELENDARSSRYDLINTTHLGKSMNFDLIEAKKSNRHFESKLWLNGSFDLINMKIHQYFHYKFHKGCIQNRILLLDKYFRKSMFYIL